MRRIQEIRLALGWSQLHMGRFLGASQRVVWSIEKGQEETGPVAFALDVLQRAIAAGRVTKGMRPDEARAVVFETIEAAE